MPTSHWEDLRDRLPGMLRHRCSGRRARNGAANRLQARTGTPVVGGVGGLAGPNGQAPRNALSHRRVHDGAHMTTPSLIQPRETMSAMAVWLLVMR